jgi:hypothetical protein
MLRDFVLIGDLLHLLPAHLPHIISRFLLVTYQLLLTTFSPSKFVICSCYTFMHSEFMSYSGGITLAWRARLTNI